MPPAPIEGSCAPSPIATSFAPLRSTTSVSRSSRSVSAIPASSKKIVVSASMSSRPRSTRETSASSVRVRPASAGLSWPSRCAVDPDTAIPKRLWPP